MRRRTTTSANRRPWKTSDFDPRLDRLVRTAHTLGIATTSTIMYGHMKTALNRARLMLDPWIPIEPDEPEPAGTAAVSDLMQR